MENCIFCKIVNKEIPSYILYEDDMFQVILDRFPSRLGHVLIVPKCHVATIFDIPDNVCEKLFPLAKRMAMAMKSAFPFDGLNVLQNNGEAAGQTIHHFHLHLIPRYKNDAVRIQWDNSDPSNEQFEEMIEKIQQFLS